MSDDLPSAARTTRWHAQPTSEVAAMLATNAKLGLTTSEADRRLARCGANALDEPSERSLARIFGSQLASPLIYLLFVAAGVALALGHRSDAVVIAAVVVVNALVGMFQEKRADDSLRALRKLAARTTRIIRDGRELIVDARTLVPGDILLVEAGDSVNADARLSETANLCVAEAALTGESLPIAKHVHVVEADSALPDRANMLYAATHVTAGRGRAIVVATGAATEIGQIAELAERSEQPTTPLERRVAQFGRYVIGASLVVFAVIVAVGAIRGLPLEEIVMVGISQVVGVVPESLPIAMTIALAVGVQRMAARRAVVRQLNAVETLGSTTVICSDKTGTLTRNELTVTDIVLPDGRELAVTGVGCSPNGAIEGVSRDELRELLEACVLCNDAQLQHDERGWMPIGDPTEVALLALAIKGGVVPTEVRGRLPRVAELPFDPETKLMATEHAKRHVVIKGAPEEVLELCADNRMMLTAAHAMASRALRVLAIAVVDGLPVHDAVHARVRLLGLVGQIDPPRDEVIDAIARCHAAGIRTVMVTGDHAATGLAIARTLGIAGDDNTAVTGRDLDRISDADLANRIGDIQVFARVQPAQKLRIIGALQARGEVVAMTGDGVNDAPALVKADVGVAMGVTGTEVAKEASKIVITDDNFATIVGAIEEGRVVYRNLEKAILLLFSTSAAEVVLLIAAILLGYPAPLAAVQILWTNLLIEGLITVNLVLEPAEGSEMQRPPVDRDEPFLNRVLASRLAFMVPAMVLSTLGWFIARMAAGIPLVQVQTETFTLLAICVWFNVLNCRSRTQSALTWSLLRNRWLVGGLVVGNLLQIAVVFWSPLASVMHTVPFDLQIVFALGVVGSLVLWVEELRKALVRRR